MFSDAVCEKVELCKSGNYPFLIHEFDYSYFIVGEHQFYQGYSLLLYKEHVRELHELSKEQYLGLSEELYIANKAIFQTFRPWKLNNQSLSNQAQHIHWHIFPRYEEDPYHKSYPFTDVMRGEVDLGNYSLSDGEARELAERIKVSLGQVIGM